MKTKPNGYGLVPGEYVAVRTAGTVGGDGTASSAAWREAARTGRFVDLVTGAPAALDTRASVLWDDENLYIAFWADEPAVVATMTIRDELLFFENDLGIFIDGGESYYELEFNALGVRHEAFYVWRDSFTRAAVGTRPGSTCTTRWCTASAAITGRPATRSGSAIIRGHALGVPER